jgi:PIN domain nuclease of toxin-antitoxin system
VKFLLDTHTFIWFITGNSQLPVQLRIMIETVENQRLISRASLWEIAIKMSLGKLFGRNFHHT